MVGSAIDQVAAHFARQLNSWQPFGRLWIALSGGADSTALLLLSQALARPDPTIKLRAVHINHQLHAEADRWQAQCARLCANLGVDLTCVGVAVAAASASAETACRAARYGAFADLLGPDDLLLTAHHAGDQAETVLLNLLRGSGPRGLGGIPTLRALGRGRVARPLLSIEPAALRRIVAAQGIEPIEDSSNLDPASPRNFLRHQVLPGLQGHWPAALKSINRSAGLARQASGLIDAQVEQLLEQLTQQSTQQSTEPLSLSGLLAQPPALQSELLRGWLQRQRLPIPQRRQLNNLLGQLSAREDAQPLASWPGCEVRRYRDLLYAARQLAAPATDWQQVWQGRSLLLPSGTGQLQWRGGSGEWPRLTVRFRRGGERIKPAGQQVTRPLKLLFQERAIPPWQRGRTPLLFAGENLVGVGDYWQTQGFVECLEREQLRLVWQRAGQGSR